MARRAPKRRRIQHDDSPPPPSHPAPQTISDLESVAALDSKWQGWAEIESDPAFFSVMLRDLGVRDVAVREIFSLDKDCLEYLPRPVHGVIFLFRWKEDEEATDTRYKAGSKVWFANQTTSNACASYALLNIVNNIPGVELGPQLEQFREFTKEFTPALRGDALANFEFVKRIHNSFTRRMDKLNGDLHMKNQVDASKQKGRKRKADDEDDEASYHFIAFMPIDGVLWKMDGLEWQPRSLGKVRSDDWLDQVKSSIESRMARYSNNEIDFAILGLVRDPLRARVVELANNVSALRNVRARLEDLKGETLEPRDGNTLVSADMSYGLSDRDIAQAPGVPDMVEALLSESVVDLEQQEKDLIDAQNELRRAAKEEQETQMQDDAKAHNRRHDYGDAIHTWLKFLVQKSAIRDIVNSSEE